MTYRKFDAEEIRRVGEDVCPKLADEYEHVVDVADSAGRFRDAFEDAAGSMSGLGGTWSQCFTLFYNAAYETGVNIRAYGAALVDIADQGQDDEALMSMSFEQAVDVGIADGYNTVSEQTADQGFNPETGDLYDLEQAPNPYQADLADPGGSMQMT